MPTLAGAVLLIDPTMLLEIVLEEGVIEGEELEGDTTGRGEEEEEEERDRERDIVEGRVSWVFI